MKSAAANDEYTPQLVGELMAKNAEQAQRIQSLQAQLDWFKRQLFGRKSEKRLLESPQQVELAELFAGTPAETAPEVPTEKITYTRRKKQRGDNCATDEGLRFDPGVPVEIIEIAHPAMSRGEADEYEVIDVEITRKLAQRPGSYVVLEYRRVVAKHKPTQTLSTAPLPAPVLDKCLADVSLLAGMLVDKFLYHLPLYRQHQRLAQAGIQLSRTSLTTWTRRAIELLRPIHEAQLKHIVQGRVVSVDETPIKAGRQHKGKMRQGWLWPVYGEDDEIAFTYSPSRGTTHLKSVLANFEGVLLSDGYSAYDSFAKDKPGIVQAQCWTHARRYFIKAQAIEPQAVDEALAHIGALYAVERTIAENDLKGEAKRQHRIEHSQPLAEAFFEWCHRQRQRIDLVNSNPLAKALTYVANHQQQMRVFLTDPDVPIDTNHVERNLRAIPMGRKNWLFAWSEVGAEHVAIIQSLLSTCRLQGVSPYIYLVDVLQRVARHPAREVEELTPRLWKERFAADPMRSALERT